MGRDGWNGLAAPANVAIQERELTQVLRSLIRGGVLGSHNVKMLKRTPECKYNTSFSGYEICHVPSVDHQNPRHSCEDITASHARNDGSRTEPQAVPSSQPVRKLVDLANLPVVLDCFDL
jgi:hypothetical protein